LDGQLAQGKLPLDERDQKLVAMADKKPDPMKDPAFRGGIETFLNTPPERHKRQGELNVEKGKPAIPKKANSAT
jgi:hypothetical protein